MPNAQELWDWKENVAAGTGWLAYHQDGHASAADQYMGDEREEAFAYGSDYIWVPDEYVGNVTFADWSDKKIEHAVAMKRYNGIGIDPVLYGYDPEVYKVGNKQYCEWDDAEHEWKFHRLAYYFYKNELCSHNYVERVCLEFP